MSVKKFRGLNNVTDPLRLGLDWFVLADNVDVTDTGAVRKRTGYTQALAGAITGAFSTFDYGRMYLVDGGALKCMTSTSAATTLKSGLSTAQMYWAEINNQVFFTNGIDSGIIHPDNTVADWRWTPPATPVLSAATGALAPGAYQVRLTFVLSDGRVTGASESAEIDLVAGQALQISEIAQIDGTTTRIYIAPPGSAVYQFAGAPTRTAMTWNSGPDDLGADLLSAFHDPLPLGCDVIQFWRGRAYAAQYSAADNMTVIWFSAPLGFHLFNLSANYITVPGRVLMLARHDDALIIGTELKIYAYDSKTLTAVADYGVVPGWHDHYEPDRTLFWTVRGLCSVMPFTNLTERQVSVAPGARAGGTVVHAEGQRRYLVSLQQGGTAFNTRT